MTSPLPKLPKAGLTTAEGDALKAQGWTHVVVHFRKADWSNEDKTGLVVSRHRTLSAAIKRAQGYRDERGAFCIAKAL